MNRRTRRITKKTQRRIRKSVTLVFLTLLLLTLALSTSAGAAELEDGAAIFSANCAACHDGGGNIIRRGKNLKQRALNRNHVNSIEAIAHLVENGKYAMPAYKDRLSGQQILAVSAYVLEQAERGWK